MEVSFRDPGVATFGLVNAVMPVGETFLEVVSPARADASAARWIARRGGDAGYMVIVQCEAAALDDAVARAEAGGARSVWRGEVEGARTVHFHPRELGAIASLDAMPSWQGWQWAGPGWREHVRRERALAITGAELAGADPAGLAGRWAALLGTGARAAGGGAFEIALARGGRLRFVPGEGEAALVAVEVALADPEAFAARARAHGVLGADGSATVAGTRFVPS